MKKIISLRKKMKRIFFYEKKNKWYMELPDFIAQGGTEADCEMVDGADTWIDKMAAGKLKISLFISDKKRMDDKVILNKEEKDGTFYLEREYKHKIWLSIKITNFLFGETPQVIYYELKK